MDCHPFLFNNHLSQMLSKKLMISNYFTFTTRKQNLHFESLISFQSHLSIVSLINYQSAIQKYILKIHSTNYEHRKKQYTVRAYTFRTLEVFFASPENNVQVVQSYMPIAKFEVQKLKMVR